MSWTNSISLIAIAGIIFFLFGKPIMGEISLLNQTKNDYHKAIDDMKNIEKIKNQLLAKLEAIPQEDQEKINAFLPDSPDIISLISEIDALGARYGIAITDINTSQIAKTSESIETTPVSKNYNSMHISFGFKTDYEKFKFFLSDIESSLRIIDIRTINVEKGEKGIYDYKITAEIYWIHEF